MGIRILLVMAATLVLAACSGPVDPQVLRGRKARKVRRVRPAPRVRRVPWVLRGRKVLRA